MIERLAIVGVGLIGGSLGLALKENGFAKTIVGVGRGISNLKTALEKGAIDFFDTDVARACTDADLVVVASALSASGEVFKNIADALSDKAVITDVGSVKQSIIEEARLSLGSSFPRFVPGHPIAGTEKSGAAAAFGELFLDHKVVLTPLSETEDSAVRLVEEMWVATGARVRRMAPKAHDELLAATSHLPHVVAYNLVDVIANGDSVSPFLEFTGGGFRDLTRIAESSAEMWTEIVFANREEVLVIGRRFEKALSRLLDALEDQDCEAIHSLFQRAQSARKKLSVPESNG